jgi:hypothetical protein
MKTASFIVIALLVSAAAIAADIRSWPEDDVLFDVVGQVKNAGTQSIQYGYLSYINGLSVEQTYAAGNSQDEKTAFFTFYNEGTTIRTVTHGLWRIVTREGTSTIYYNVAPHGDLTTPLPDSFRSGTPIVTSTWRHQVVFEPSPTGHFFVTFVHTITGSSPVTVGGETLRIGKIGDKYKVALFGGPDPAGLVNGKFAGNGVAIGTGRGNVHDEVRTDGLESRRQ